MTWAYYLLQVNIYIVIFYVFYRIFLDRETWFVLNRIYLLSAGTLSMLIPFIKPEWILPESANAGIVISAGQLDILVADAKILPDAGFNWGGLISAIYICGIVFFAARLIWRLFHVSLLIRANPEGMAFSFFGTKVIDRKLPGQKAIHGHEDIHIRQYHTADVIFFELLAIVLWCNPVIYQYKLSIKNIHEYLADEYAAKLEGDKESYAILLLCKALKVDQSVLTNSFFSKSLIKKRIIMLNKQRSTRTAILKYGLFLPLFAGMLLLSSAKISRNENIKDIAEQIKAPVIIASVSNSASNAAAANTFNEADTPQKRLQIKTVKATGKLPAGTKAGNKANTSSTSPAQQEKPYDFNSTTTTPSFPGGMEKFYKYLAAACKYPKEAIEKNVEGKVFLSYIVEKNGSISDVKVVRRLGSGTDEEAVRLLENSPKWIPGTVDNKPVRVQLNLPINFSLSKDKGVEPNMNKAPSVNPTGTRPEDGAKTIPSGSPAGVKPEDGAKTISSGGPAKLKASDVSLAGRRIRISKQDNPLVYIDGVKSSLTLMNQLDVNTIESIRVEKDKTVVTGNVPEWTNAAVMITTKKSKQDNTFSTAESPIQGHP
ncbi:MAG: TonB family protein [Pedobacter sp.]|uniref:TonB family protein n=1 Tax=Pedobacter sp. TaxID=1411316 RepID=UPI003391D70A